ncbi:glycosyltransferase [bacterium]|nr:glycosyltransferase [candidate division CSSED10-310 bacterium]
MSVVNVARIISGLWKGGVEKKLALTLPLFDRKRFNIRVICLREEGFYARSLRDEGIPVIVSHVGSRWSPSGLWNLRKILRNLNIDIVHTHMYRANTSGTFAARWADVPVLISQLHNVNPWDGPGQIRMDRILAPMKDMFIFVSKTVRDSFVSKVPVPDQRQRVIYNGVDIERFESGRSNPMNFKGSVRIGAVGRLMPVKGFQILLALLLEKGLTDPGIQLYIAGEGPMRLELQNLIQKYRLTGRVHIMGHLENIPEFLNSVDILAMPSQREGFSNALLEAMAAGVPVVAFGVGGIPEAIRDGEDGFLVEPEDMESFGNALKCLIDSPDLRSKMSGSIRQRVRAYSIENMVKSTEELYEELMTRKSGQIPGPEI